MAGHLKNLSEHNPEEIPSGEGFKIALIVSDYYLDITSSLYQACRETLLKNGVEEKDISVFTVPGAYELTAGAQMVAESAVLADAFICLGCVIKGETKHDEYINHAVSKGLTDLIIKFNKPFIFGLLTPDNRQQALDRAGGVHGNKGTEAAIAALKMLDLKRQLTNHGKKSIGFNS